MRPVRRVPLVDPVDGETVGWAMFDYFGSAPDSVTVKTDGDRIDLEKTLAPYGSGGWATVRDVVDLAGISGDRARFHLAQQEADA